MASSRPMGMRCLLIAVSPFRRAQLRRDGLVDTFIARLEGPSEGTLDLDKAWDVLDRILRLEGPPVLGDAILARRGKPFGDDLGYGPAKELDPTRVAEIADALDQVPYDAAAVHLPSLIGQDVYAFLPPGLPPNELAAMVEDDAVALTHRLTALKAFYRGAASRGEAVLAVIA